jgi:hypothetical protein
MREFKDTNEVKEFFRQIRKEQAEIRHLEALISKTRLSLLPQGFRYDTDKVQTSPADPITEKAAIIADYTRQLNESLSKLVKRKIEAEQLIMSLDNTDERDIMRLYYMETQEASNTKERVSYSWDQVASEKYMNKRWVLKLHGRALVHLQTKEDTKRHQEV